MSGEPKLTPVYTAKYMECQIIKSRLESEGIPAILKYESAGLVYGLTADGLGETTVLVPEDLAQEAKEILDTENMDITGDLEETES
ncbi:putative signal transducing protein [Chloroflexota bacterium]